MTDDYLRRCHDELDALHIPHGRMLLARIRILCDMYKSARALSHAPEPLWRTLNGYPYEIRETVSAQATESDG